MLFLSLCDDILNEISHFIDIKSKCILDCVNKSLSNKILTNVFVVDFYQLLDKSFVQNLLQQHKFLTLINLNCNFSQISDLNYLTKLEILSCKNTQLNDNSIINLKSLKKIICSNTNLTEFNYFIKLTELNCSKCLKIHNKSFYQCYNLTILDCSDTTLKVIQDFPNLTKLKFTNYLNRFHNFEIINCENLKYLEISCLGIHDLPFENLRELSIYECPNISDNSIIKCNKLEILKFHQTPITNLNKFKKLKVLMTSSREITDETIKNCLKLEKLVCSGSSLTKFNGFKDLTILDCEDCTTTLESFKGCENLTSLNISHYENFQRSDFNFLTKLLSIRINGELIK